jgi:hypothetical protein
MGSYQAFSDYTDALELDIPGTSAPMSVETEQCLTTLSYDQPTHTADPSTIYSLSDITDIQSEGAPQFPDSDQDAEGETDDEDDYDYGNKVQDPTYMTPSLEPAIRCSNRAARYASTMAPYSSSRSARALKSSSSSLGKELCHDSSDTKPIEALPRLKQATDSNPNYTALNANGDFQCQNCGYACKPTREVDFKRHVDTHYRKVVPPKGPVLCCGIPIKQRNHPQYIGKVPSNASVKRFYGQKMVGGCGKLFSRPDSLKRHLDMPHSPCFGDLRGDWHPQKYQKLD